MTSSLDRYLAALYGRAPAGSFVEIRHRTPFGMAREFHDVGRPADVASSIARLAAMTDVYVGVVPRRHRHGGGHDDLMPHAQTVWVDCDAPESVVALRRFSPAPSIIVRTGTGDHRHAYWLLRAAVDLDAIEHTNRRLAVALGGDPACSDAARILRPPSVNWKTRPPAPVTLERCRARPPCRIDDILDHLPPLPDRAAPHERNPPRTLTDDPLLEISPPVFVQRLTGIRVPRSGKIACPFHPDRTPSLHVYPDAEQGWFCFGCRRGGSVYDFAAERWSMSTRGDDFIALRDRLHALLLLRPVSKVKGSFQS